MIPPGTNCPEPERHRSARDEDLSEIELGAWRGMLRIAHRLRRDLDADLVRRHGLSMADYDALVALAARPDRSMRMSRLAEVILQPRSSLTRLVTSLEERGLVHRTPAEDDARGATASLTSAGRRAFARAHRTHVAGIRSRFLDDLTTDQLVGLRNAWAAVDPELLA